MAATLPGFTVEILRQIDSSNSELMRRFRAAAPEPGAAGHMPAALLLVAEQQTAGRGRLGRSWHSRAGAGLTFSLGLCLKPADWSGLSLAVGLSLAESLDPAPPERVAAGPPRIQLKWPNDLWLNDRKLAGILVETASWGALRYVVIGVGINVWPPEPGWVPEPSAWGAAPAAASLQELWPGIEAPAALQAVVAPLLRVVQAFESAGFAPLQARFAARDALAGRPVQLSDGSRGVASGVGENGALRVHTAAGMQEISSSEVSVRPASPGPDEPPAAARKAAC